MTIAHMLPPRPRVINRHEIKRWVLSEVASASQDNRICLLWLTGVPGVGKSALAVDVAYMLTEHCPDGQFYYHLRGLKAEGPAHSGEVLTAFLRHSGTQRDAMPESFEDRQWAFRSQFFDRRILVVLDDAADLPTVMDLLPTSRRAVVIVTSMAQMTGTEIEGFEERSVTALDPEFCLQMLTRYLGVERVDTERGAAEELASACGYLPGGLAPLCAHIARRPDRRLADFVARLRADPTHTYDSYFSNSPLLVPFGFVLRSIRRDLASAYLILSLHPGPDLRDRSTAAMLNQTVEDAGEVLAELTQENLLQRSSDGAYRFHAFAAWYVRRKAEEEMSEAERSAALERLVTYRLEQAVGLAKRLWPKRPWIGEVFERVPRAYRGTDARRAAAAEFEAEETNLRASAELASTMGLAAECAYLALALKQWFYETGQPAVLVPMMERAAEAAGQLDDRPLNILMQNELGTAYELAGRFAEALAAFQRSEMLAREHGDAVAVASAVSWRGIIELQVGNSGRAMELLLAARDITHSAAYGPAGRPRMLALLSMHIGRALHSMGEDEHAVRESEAALTFFAEQDDDESANIFRSASTLNDALVKLGRVREANTRLGDAMSAVDDARLRVQRIGAWRSLAHNHRILGDQARALVCLREARALAHALNLVMLELTIIADLVGLHGEMGDVQAATGLLLNARKAAGALGAVTDRVAVLRSIAACYRNLGDDAAAQSCDDEAIAVTNEIDEVDGP